VIRWRALEAACKQAPTTGRTLFISGTAKDPSARPLARILMDSSLRSE